MPPRSASSSPRRSKSPAVLDLVILGGGLSGLIAARRATEKGLKVLVLESDAHVGGRACGESLGDRIRACPPAARARLLAVARASGTDIDKKRLQHGGYWFHGVGRTRHGHHDTNPFHAFALSQGFHGETTEVDPNVGTVFIDGRPATRAEVADYEAEERLFIKHVKAKTTKKHDGNAALMLDWHARFARVVADELGPLDLSGDIAGASAEDVADFRSGHDVACKEGMDVLVRSLAKGFPVKTRARATRVEWSAEGVEVKLEDGRRIAAKRALITVPLSVLQSRGFTFAPPLPQAKQRALSNLEMGLMNKTFLLFDAPVFAKFKTSTWCILAERDKKGRLSESSAIVVNADGVPFLGIVFTGGRFGQRLEKKGADEQNDFAREKAAHVLGEDVVQRHCAAACSTRWMEWNGGSYSFALAGKAGAHDDLARKLESPRGAGRVYFAGEACEGPKSGWGGSFAAAYLTGLRAAEEIAHDDAHDA